MYVLTYLTHHGSTSRCSSIRHGELVRQMAVEFTQLASESMASTPDQNYDHMPAQVLNPNRESASTATSDEVRTARRTKLRSYDQFAAQMLNPSAETSIAPTSLSNISGAMATISTAPTYSSDLCAPPMTTETPISNEALSRLAEAMKKRNIAVPDFSEFHTPGRRGIAIDGLSETSSELE